MIFVKVIVMVEHQYDNEQEHKSLVQNLYVSIVLYLLSVTNQYEEVFSRSFEKTILYCEHITDIFRKRF